MKKNRPACAQRLLKFNCALLGALAGVPQSCISQGFPLSVPAACGCHEIDHLKCQPYPMLIIPSLIFFVKDFTLPKQSPETLWTNAPKRYDGIPVRDRVACHFEAQNHFCNGVLFHNLFQNQSRIRSVPLQNIIRILDDLRKVLGEPIICSRVFLLDMNDLLLSNNNLIRLYIIRYNAVEFTIQPANKIHVRVPAISIIRWVQYTILCGAIQLFVSCIRPCPLPGKRRRPACLAAPPRGR